VATLRRGMPQGSGSPDDLLRSKRPIFQVNKYFTAPTNTLKTPMPPMKPIKLLTVLAAQTALIFAAAQLSAQSLSYSNAVTGLNASGYWPMHESAAAAPGDIETNYGTLGALGNGYYPDWSVNSGAFVRQKPGPLANGVDESVYFT
jgi:hypothetical protein